MYGNLYQVDTARVESHHKKKKIIGKQTQRRIEYFDEHTATGEYKFNLFIKALQTAGIPVAKMFETASNLNIKDHNKNHHEVEESSTTSDKTINFDMEISISNIMKASSKKTEDHHSFLPLII